MEGAKIKTMFIAKQHSALSAFTYDIFDTWGHLVGELRWPDFAVANNARLKSLVPAGLTTKIQLTYQQRVYDIAFEYLTRDWYNDIRFFLKDGDTTLAIADSIGVKKLFKQPVIMLKTPFEGLLKRTSGLFSARYTLISDGAALGTVAEKRGLQVKRELFIDLPDTISPQIQIFIFFLVCNQSYR